MKVIEYKIIDNNKNLITLVVDEKSGYLELYGKYPSKLKSIIQLFGKHIKAEEVYNGYVKDHVIVFKILSDISLDSFKYKVCDSGFRISENQIPEKTMSEKYKIIGPDGEEVGINFFPNKKIISIGSKTRFKPFMDHIVFGLMGFGVENIEHEEYRQKHKYRYTFNLETVEFRIIQYKLMEKYTVEEIESIIKIM